MISSAPPVDAATRPAAPDRCPACGAASRPWIRLGAISVRRCPACGHRVTEGTAEAAGELERIYDDGYAGFREDPRFEHAVRELLRRDFAPRLPAGARILDVGCGNGQFLAAAAEAGYRGTGLDVSEAAAALCRGRGLDARAGDFLTLPLEGGYDAVTLWDVIEHLPDPAAFLRRAHELLAPGGWLFLKTPGAGDFVFRVAQAVPRLAGTLLSTPAHVQFFTKASMERLAARAGFAHAEVVHGGGMRSPPSGGTLRRRAGRLLLAAVTTAARNGNWYVWMRKEPAA